MLIKGIFTKLDALTKYDMKIYRLILITILSMSFGMSRAQNSEFENFLLGGVDDANLLLGHYISPALKGMGYGFNNGWYNTAKPHKTLGFDLMIIPLNVAFVPDEDQSFVFNNTDYNNTRLVSGTSAVLPTVAGIDSEELLENFITDPALPGGELILGRFSAPDGIADDLEKIKLNRVAIPAPVVQVGVGIYKGTDIKIRWLPFISQDNLKFKYFGIGGMHSISQWIPALKNVPFLDISAVFGFTNIYAEYAIPTTNTIQTTDAIAVYEVNTLTYQLLVSAHVSVITGYIGLGMDNYKTTFKMLGQYTLQYPDATDGLGNSIPVPDQILTNPINFEEKGEGGFRTTVGARLKFAVFTIHGDYTIREYNTLTVGIGFSVR